jgi:hypothetical protein
MESTTPLPIPSPSSRSSTATVTYDESRKRRKSSQSTISTASAASSVSSDTASIRICLRRPIHKDLRIKSYMEEANPQFPPLTTIVYDGIPLDTGHSWLDDDSSEASEADDEDEEEDEDEKIARRVLVSFHDDLEKGSQYDYSPKFSLDGTACNISRCASSDVMPSFFDWDSDVTSSCGYSPITPRFVRPSEVYSDSGVGDCDTVADSTEPPSFAELDQYDQEAYLEVSRILSNMIVDTPFDDPLRSDLERTQGVLRHVADQRSAAVLATADVARVEKPKPITYRRSTLINNEEFYQDDGVWF